MSAVLLKPGQNAGMDDETLLLQQSDFPISCKRGNTGTPADWHVYPHCEWSSVRVASTLDQVTLTADFSVPGYSPVNG
jgi:hypothetical protein